MSDSGCSGKTGTMAFPGGRGDTVPGCVLKALLVLVFTLSFFAVGIIPLQAEEEPRLEWETSFGWPGYRNHVVTAAQLDDGGYMVAAEKRLDVDWRSDTYVTVGACVVKIDANGQKVWEKALADDCGGVVDAVQTADGGLVLTGATGSFPGWENIYLVKVDASGNNGWEKTFGWDGDFHDYGAGVRETKDGGFIVLGDSSPFRITGARTCRVIPVKGRTCQT